VAIDVTGFTPVTASLRWRASGGGFVTSIQRNWNGRIYGTNTGNVAIQLDGEDDHITGTVRLLDDKFGLAVYTVTGTYAEGVLKLEGTPQGQPPEGMVYGNLTAEGKLQADGRLDGEWSTTIGSGGTWQAWAHGAAAQAPKPNVPEQINTCTRQLGAVRLYAEDVDSLVTQLLKEFTAPRAIVSYHENGNEKNVYSGDFAAILAKLPEQRYLKLSVQEPDLYGINRSAIVELNATGDNVVRVQGVQESWVIGKAQTLHDHVQSFHKKLATQFRRFGLNVNIAINLVALAALPGLAGFWRRLAFVLSVAVIQLGISFFHRRYVPNFILYPAKRKATLLGKIGPGATSWGITILGGVVVLIIYGLLKGELANTPLSHLFNAMF
jgi:hypothetical protein